MWPKNNTELRQWALDMDAADPLQFFRERFHIPQRQHQPLSYFCGNSLGLQPKAAQIAINQELTTWQNLGVEGWFEGENPWLGYHRHCQNALAHITGAQPQEVCPMNQLTVNLHLMLTSFYRPTARRYKILTVASDFPSDQYALETHLRTRGYDPADALIEVKPQAGNFTVSTADLLAVIDTHADSLALVCMSGLHYYTGQLFDMSAIAQATHRAGAWVGFDLAHAVGNAPLQLHDWGVDFAVWCSYKYLNSGPGGVSGVFVHQKHHSSDLPRLAGWWGYDEARRFEMTKGFVPMEGAAGWQLSTPNILALAAHRASLAIFEEATMPLLRQKSELLTGFLEALIQRINEESNDLKITQMTPTNPAERGAQLSLLVHQNGKMVFEALTQAGIIGDWREPNCIRLAPAPLYNTFEEVYRVYEVLRPMGL